MSLLVILLFSSFQYKSPHISLHHSAWSQRLHVRWDGAFGAWRSLCCEEGPRVKVCRTRRGCCWGSFVDLPGELRYQHGGFIKHSPVGIPLECRNQRSNICFLSSGFKRTISNCWVCAFSSRNTEDSGCECSTGLHRPGGQTEGFP